jgi:hypothetical protein
MSSITRWVEPAELQQRDRERGAGAVGQTESEWSQLIGMLDLAQRWQELIGDFTSEDADPWLAASASTWPASRAAGAMSFDGVAMTESVACLMHNSDLYPDAQLARAPGTPERGQCANAIKKAHADANDDGDHLMITLVVESIADDFESGQEPGFNHERLLEAAR